MKIAFNSSKHRYLASNTSVHIQIPPSCLLSSLSTHLPFSIHKHTQTASSIIIKSQSLLSHFLPRSAKQKNYTIPSILSHPTRTITNANKAAQRSKYPSSKKQAASAPNESKAHTVHLCNHPNLYIKTKEQKRKASKRGRSLHIHTTANDKTGISGYSFVYHPERLSCIQRTSFHPTQLSGIMDKVLRFQDGGQGMEQNKSVLIESRRRQVV